MANSVSAKSKQPSVAIPSTTYKLPSTKRGFTHTSPRLPTLLKLRRTSRRIKVASPAFTIVELLVVIVVIGILATITIVSYTGISQRATNSSLQSDLANAKKQLALYYVDHGSYPTGLNGSNCPTGSDPSPDTRYCIKVSPGNSFGSSYNSTNPQTFTLDATHGTTTYRVTESTGPVNVAITPITAIATITGTTTVGSVLTVGALTPGGATASYQWQRCNNSDGTSCTNIGTNSTTYTLVSGDWFKYIKVTATGTGSYSGTQTSAASAMVSDPNWIAGIAATAMAGKYVRNADLGSTYIYKPSVDAVASPQGATGLDPNYPSNMSLVSPQANPGVDFSAYPAQNACKAIGGRLPNMQELNAIYTGRATYGNNFWAFRYSSTEVYGGMAYGVNFDTGGAVMNGETYSSWVRCVSG